MAFPTLLGYNRTQNTNKLSTHAVKMPTSVSAGNYIVVLAGFSEKVNPTAPTGTLSWNYIKNTWWAQSTPAKDVTWTNAVFILDAAGNEAGTTKDFVISSSAFAVFLAVTVSGASSYSFGNWNSSICCPPTPNASVATMSGPRDMLVVDHWARNSPTFTNSQWSINNWNQYTFIGAGTSGTCNTANKYPYKDTVNVGGAWKNFSAADTTYSGDNTTQVYKNNFLVYDGQATGQNWGTTTSFNKKCNPNALATSQQISFFV